MGRAGGQVSLEKVVRLHPRPHQTAEQRLQGLRGVVDAAKENSLIQDRHAGGDEPTDGLTKLIRELPGMVGVYDRPHGARLPEHQRQVLGDPRGMHHRHARTDAKHVGRVDTEETVNNGAQVPVGQHEGVAAGQQHFVNGGCVGQVGAGRLQLLRGDLSAAMAGEVAAEAMPAVGGAPVAHQEQRAVGIVVDEPLRDQIACVTDGIRGFIGKGDKLTRARNELRGNRIRVRILASGQGGVGAAHAVGKLGHGLAPVQVLHVRHCNPTARSSWSGTPRSPAG